MKRSTDGSDSTASSTPALRVTCWGARGSVPSPGPSTAHFGGNTSCLEVRSSDDRCFIFDGGTGIRSLGRRLSSAGPTTADLFLTHFHWDHIQGLPFFAPLYDQATALRVHGAEQGGVGVRELFAGQMDEAHFPVPFHSVRAAVDFADIERDPWSRQGVEVEAMRVFHPATTFGYRIRAGGASMAFLPDNEVRSASRAGYRDLVRFLGGVDLLFHDAMYTEQEYPAREGWGHSTFLQAIQLAEEAGVRRLCLFHHAPDRTDAELFEILDDLSTDLLRRGSALEISVATEGEELMLWGEQ